MSYCCDFAHIILVNLDYIIWHFTWIKIVWLFNDNVSQVVVREKSRDFPEVTQNVLRPTALSR